MLFGPMVTPLARRRPQVLARQAASLAVLSGGRFVLGLGLGDDWVGEFSAFGDEPDPGCAAGCSTRGSRSSPRCCPAGPWPTKGGHYSARDVRFHPAPAVPIWLAGRFGHQAPLRRAARHDGFFVIGLDAPGDLDEVTSAPGAHDRATRASRWSW